MNITYTHHLGVYAIIERENAGEILLIKKARGPYTGLLDFPGGSLEPHEILEQTLCREVTEETGLDVAHCKQHKTLSCLFEFEEGGKQKVLRHVGVLYRAEVEGCNLKQIGDGEDSNGAVWVKKQALKSENITPFVSLYLGK